MFSIMKNANKNSNSKNRNELLVTFKGIKYGAFAGFIATCARDQQDSLRFISIRHACALEVGRPVEIGHVSVELNLRFVLFKM